MTQEEIDFEKSILKRLVEMYDVYNLEGTRRDGDFIHAGLNDCILELSANISSNQQNKNQ